MTAWGEPADGTWSNGPGYTGHQMDAASKLVYMQQRYYDPAIGRFLSADPMASDMQNGWNFNRYNYAANNPYKNVDPDGRACDSLSGGGCGMTASGQSTGTQGSIEEVAELAVDFTPILGDGKAIGEAIADPTAVNVIAAVVGVVPGAGDLAGKALKKAAKVFSKEKQALVEMAKADKRTGMTEADMKAYQELNSELPDPFPPEKVRGPEAHDSGAPSSQEPHGHVGPVDHIPIRDKD
ncbi:hypothetical protein C6N40_12900 [Arenimonas caeni]|uniref:RHS repeat-associated core domain-containing protein n=2 Tax=Arenimonas caeni TaxID=2058085 RepID=A0A2P6M5Y7_9GAMM|nr:hypothetical protein C6N40_12900 [Arenimonas caeni]